MMDRLRFGDVTLAVYDDGRVELMRPVDESESEA